MIQKLYTLEQIEELTGVKARTLRAKIKEGKLKARKLSRNWRVTEEDLQAFIDSAPTNIPGTSKE